MDDITKAAEVRQQIDKVISRLETLKVQLGFGKFGKACPEVDLHSHQHMEGDTIQWTVIVNIKHPS
jgi:hypothetical protein